MIRLKQVTEEVARWVFEVHLTSETNWDIAFTNPTAGPWKRVMASDQWGRRGEVHRFLREDTRPDLILISDELEAIVIVEAKTRVEQLLTERQATKTVAVVKEMAELLQGRGSNPYWQRRANYGTLCGLLWGGERKASPETLDKLKRTYLPIIASGSQISTSILTVECLREPDQAHVRCSGRLEGMPQTGDLWAQKVLDSLNLNTE